MPSLAPAIEAEYFRVRSVRNEVARLRASVRFNESAGFLLEVLLHALDTVAAEFGTLVNNTEGEVSLAARCGSAASDIHSLLQFVEGSDQSLASSALVEPLQTLAKQYMPECRLLVRGAYKGGLSGYWCEFFIPFLRDLLDRLPGCERFVSMLDGFVSVVFPSAEKENLLMHALLGHELGHGFSEDLKIELTVRMSPEAEAILQELPAGAMEEFAPVLATWLGELLADAWGVHIMGPAYYFACRKAIARTPPCDSHPSGRFRLGLLGEQLERRGYLKPSKGVTGWLGSTVEEDRESLCATNSAVVMGELEEEFYRAVEISLKAHREGVFAAVEGQRAQQAFTPDRLVGVCTSLSDRLCYLVPPDEAREVPVSLPDVLNAGWLVRLRQWEKFRSALGIHGDSDGAFAALATLNRLLLKALEYLAVRKQWEAAGDTGGEANQGMVQ